MVKIHSFSTIPLVNLILALVASLDSFLIDKLNRFSYLSKN